MLAGRRVLIVEDDSRLAAHPSTSLPSEDDRETVADRVSGVDLAGSLLPEAIILDIQLPRLSGLNALAILRQDEGASSVLVVVLSNDDALTVVEEAGRLGVSTHLIKRVVLPQDVAEALSDVWHGRGEMVAGLPSREGAPAPEEVVGAAARVLVVDAQAATRRLVQTALEVDGYQVVGTAGGEAAWNLLEELRPSVVVAHVWMPGLDGLELCRRIKAEDTMGQIKVILYTVAITGEPATEPGCDRSRLMTSALSGLRDAVGRLS